MPVTELVFQSRKLVTMIMDNLDVSRWKAFKVGDLLTKVKTKKVPFKALDLPVNPTDNCYLPLVAAGVDNQGRSRYVDPKYATVLHGCLTVSANGANSGATFYQDSDFSILQDAYALELVDKYKSMGVDNIYLFLAAVIRRGLINNDWSNKATWTRVQKTIIRLPVTSSGEPDWQYMDSYIAKLTTRSYQEVSLLERGKEKSEPLNISGWIGRRCVSESSTSLDSAELSVFVGDWKEFKIGQMFDIETGGDLVFRNLLEGEIPVVSHSMENNGIKGYYQRIEGRKRYDHEITLALADRGTFFASSQTKDFYVATRVKALIFKDRKYINENIRLFLCSVINRLALRFVDYSENATNRLPSSIIKLPVDINGHPDWQYMDNYVEFMKLIADRNVGFFQSIIKK